MSLSAISGVVSGLADLRKRLADPSDTSLQARFNRGLCDVYASNASASLVTGLGGAAVMEELCRPYWASQGDNPQLSKSPFTGGQCVTNYRVTGSGRTTGGDTFTASTGNQQVTGPITSIEPLLRPDGLANVFRVKTATNTFGITSASFGNNSTIGIVPSTLTFAIVRLDGQPDNCGNPPDVVSPDPTYSKPRPIGSPTDIGSPGGAPDRWIFSPTPDGGLQGNPVPSPTGGYPPSFPGIEFPGFSPVGTGGESSIPDPIVEGEPTESPDEPTGNGEETAPNTPGVGEEPNTEYVCIGYRWVLLGFPSREGKVIGTDTVFPRVVGNLQLKIREGEDGFVRGDNLRMYSDKGILLVPDSRLVCRGIFWSKAIPGRINLTPLYASKSKPISEV